MSGSHSVISDTESEKWPLTQHLEKQILADSVFFSPGFLKLFGFQYKTLYRNGGDFWMLDPPAAHDTASPSMDILLLL